MKLGEWLLIRHADHLRQLTLLKARREQCKHVYSNLSETIEQLALHRNALDEPPSGSYFSDPTYRTAFEYAKEDEKEKQLLQQQIGHLDRSIRAVQDYINIFTIVLNNMNENDRWFIEHHFVQGTNIVDLKNEIFPDGKYNSKTTLHNIKNRIIDEVTAMCELLSFHPSDFDEAAQ